MDYFLDIPQSLLHGRSFDRARFDDRHTNAERFQLHAQSVAESSEGRFAGVDQAAEGYGNMCADRTDVHDASPCLAYQRQEGLRHRDLAKNIDFENVPQVRGRNVFNWTYHPDAGDIY